MDLKIAKSILTLRNKKIQLVFNMNGCFGSKTELFCGVGNLKLTEFLYTNDFEVYCFETDKECISYFKSFKNEGVNINIHIGPEETFVKKQKLSKNGKSKNKYEEVFNNTLLEFLNMPKIDLTIMNPPYSFKEDNNLDMNIVDKCIDKSNETIIIMPNKLYYKFQSVDKFYNNVN